MFSEHLAFDTASIRIRFDAAILGAPVVQNAATLRQLLRTAPQSVFLKYKNEDSWTARLRRRLKASVDGSDWPLLNKLADEFNLTPATLRRRLEAEGTSYQDVKEQLRRDLAIDRLCNSTMSVADIAALAGFRETSAFHRTFRVERRSARRVPAAASEATEQDRGGRSDAALNPCRRCLTRVTRSRHPPPAGPAPESARRRAQRRGACCAAPARCARRC
jgi:AraC-like DNA-binding protein